MGKRLFLAATLATLLASMGCTRCWCERHGYYPPQQAAAPCCVPCCPPCAPGPAAVGYAPAPPAWNAPAAAVPASSGACCCPPPPTH
ncbi:MAG TPA: hypothetical protein VH643_08140 [Gemmataceae bacterium]